MEPKVDKAQFGEWKRHPVTVEVFRMLSERVEGLEKCPWVDLLDSNNAHRTQSNLSEMAGRCSELQILLDIEHEDLVLALYEGGEDGD